MYEIIESMIAHTWETGDSSQQIIYYICGALIIVITAVLLDMLYRTFSSFWR